MGASVWRSALEQAPCVHNAMLYRYKTVADYLPTLPTEDTACQTSPRLLESWVDSATGPRGLHSGRNSHAHTTSAGMGAPTSSHDHQSADDSALSTSHGNPESGHSIGNDSRGTAGGATAALGSSEGVGLTGSSGAESKLGGSDHVGSGRGSGMSHGDVAPRGMGFNASGTAGHDCGVDGAAAAHGGAGTAVGAGAGAGTGEDAGAGAGAGARASAGAGAGTGAGAGAGAGAGDGEQGKQQENSNATEDRVGPGESELALAREDAMKRLTALSDDQLYVQVNAGLRLVLSSRIAICYHGQHTTGATRQ